MAVNKQMADEILAEVDGLLAQGAADQAISLLFGLTTEKNTDYRLLERLGLMLMERRDFDAAVDVFQKTVRLKPNMGQAHAALAGALEAVGDHDRATSHRELALELGWTGEIISAKDDSRQEPADAPGGAEKNAVSAEKPVSAKPEPEKSSCSRVGGTEASEGRQPNAQTRGQAVTVHKSPHDLLAMDDDLFVLNGKQEKKAPTFAVEAAPAEIERRETKKVNAKRNIKLRILFLREEPDQRMFAMAHALSKLGHEVNLGYLRGSKDFRSPYPLEDCFAKKFLINDYQHVWNISERFDIIHCHNGPDVYSCVAIVSKARVVHDSRGLLSQTKPGDRSIKYFEGVANRGANGRVYTSQSQMDQAKRLYGVSGPSIVLDEDLAAMEQGIDTLVDLYHDVLHLKSVKLRDGLSVKADPVIQNIPGGAAASEKEDQRRTLLLVNADVDYSSLLEALEKEPGQVVVGSVDKALMQKIRSNVENNMGPDDVGQTFWMEKYDWGIVYPERKRHYADFQKLFKPLMELPKVRQFGHMDIYAEEEFNQAHGVGVSYFKLIDILHDMLDQYRPDRVISLENGAPQPTAVSAVVQDMAKNMGFEVKVLHEQKAANPM